MAKTTASKSPTALRKSAKPPVLPKGYGSLRGQLHIRRGIDLTKPIYEQVLKLDRKERRSAVGRNSEAYSAILMR